MGFYSRCFDEPAPPPTILTLQQLAWERFDQEAAKMKLRKAAMEQCRPEFCQNLLWEGDPDLAGIGVLASYYVLAAFATLALIIFAGAEYFNDNYHAWPRPTRKNIQVFWTTSLYLAIVVGVAGIVVVFDSRGTQYTTTCVILGLMVTLSGAHAVWPLQQSASEETSWSGNLCEKSFLIFLDIILLIICTYIEITDQWNEPFELYCFDSSTIHVLWHIGTLLRMMLWLIPLFLATTAATWINHRWLFGTAMVSVSLDRISRYGICLASFIIMWLSVALLWILRSQMTNFVGPSYQENTWGLGQIVVVMAWLPMLVEMGKGLVICVFHK